MPSRSVVAAVLVLMCATAAAGFGWGTYAAGGADSYGYVSQAHAWLESGVPLHEPLAAGLTIHNAPWVAAPLGWRPGTHPGDLVPIYPPGLPLLMAVAILAAGPSAVFALSPLLGAVAVGSTYLLARTIAPPRTCVFAAALVATNPTFLYQLVQPMSDVPVTGLWTACLVTLRSRRRSAWLAAGMLAGVAILVRPNLAPLALIAIGFGMAMRRDEADTDEGSLQAHTASAGQSSMGASLAAYLVPVVVAVATLARINASWYGSPVHSGYGTADTLFSLRHVGVNLRLYGSWLLATNPIALPLAAAATVVLVATRRPVGGRPRPIVAMAAWIVAVLALYLPYRPFEHWWYTRFLLPGIPALMALVSLVLASCAREWRVPRVASLAVAGGMVLGALVIAHQRGVFELRRIEAKYEEAGRAVRVLLPPDAVILAMQHSGSLRFYAGRTTLRWELLRPGDLDALLRQLKQMGKQPYAVLDPAERTAFLERFRGSRTVRDWHYGHVYLTRHDVELMALAP